jgi:hypothetical protein
MKKRIHFFLFGSGISLVLVLLAFVVVKAATTIGIIDHFDTFQTISAPGPSGSAADYIADSSVLGDERDIQAQVTSGVSGESVDVSTDTGGNSIYSHSQGVTTQGWSQIVWDGPDHNATTIDYTGLGGVDLTNGSLSDRFVIGIAHKDSPQATILMTVYTDQDNWSEYTLPMPTLINSLTEFQLLFADFTTGSGASGPADFTNVGAVALMVDGTLFQSRGLDMDIHYVELGPFDWGDLPESGTHYATTLSRNGPRHSSNGLILGSLIDFENNGQPNADATGDDLAGIDDEEGVVRPSNWTQGAGGGPIDVTVTGGDGCLNGWIDWGNDGSMATSGDKVFSKTPVTTGVNHFTIDVPVDPNSQSFFALFRLSPRDSDNLCTTPVGLTGAVTGGEVESYKWSFGVTAITLSSLTARPNTTITTPVTLVSLSLLVLVALGAFTWLRRQRA